MNLDECKVNDEEGGSSGLTTNTLNRESAQWRAAVYARLGTASKIVSEIQSLEMVKFTEIDRRLRRMEALLKAVANSPGQAIGRTDRGTAIRVGTAADGGDSRPDSLYRNPRTLSIPCGFAAFSISGLTDGVYGAEGLFSAATIPPAGQKARPLSKPVARRGYPFLSEG